MLQKFVSFFFSKFKFEKLKIYSHFKSNLSIFLVESIGFIKMLLLFNNENSIDPNGLNSTYKYGFKNSSSQYNTLCTL